MAVAGLFGVGTATATAAKAETSSIICSGSAACAAVGRSDHGWPAHINEGRWQTFPGHNCTGYAAYALETLNGAKHPGGALGDGRKWDEYAIGKDIPVDRTPKLGSIAQWDGNQGMSEFGHVAYVEEVGSNYVVVSEDVYPSGPFSYRKVNKPAGGWTIDFIHFKDRPPTPPGPGALKNGGFDAGSTGWTAGGVNFTTYASSGGTKPHQGGRFAATNNPSGGGSLRQDVKGTVKTGATCCTSARVTTVGTGSGARGTLAMWFLGGSKNEKSDVSFAALPGAGKWTLVRTCATATVSHSSVRVEFYPATNAPTMGIDAVDLRGSLAKNGGFNNGSTGWSVTGSANFITYAGNAYEGTRYAATNARKSGDSFRQDIKGSFGKGGRYCLDAQVRTAGGRTGAGVDMAPYALGAATEKAHVNTGRLGSGWGNVSTCLTLKSAHSTLRVQLYPITGAPTLNVDSVFLRRM